jgi:hypothetical protein
MKFEARLKLEYILVHKTTKSAKNARGMPESARRNDKNYISK